MHRLQAIGQQLSSGAERTPGRAAAGAPAAQPWLSAAAAIRPHWALAGAADPPPFAAFDPGVPEARDPGAATSVFLLLGQSSMAGRGMLPAFQELIPDIQAFHYLHDSWQVAREPLHFDPMIRDAGIIGKSAYPAGAGLGLGYSFARAVLASGAVDGQVGLIPCAYGGSPLSRWEKQPGLADAWEGNALNVAPNNTPEAKPGDLYARMVRRTRLALAQGNCVLRGALWHQGESDCTTLELAQSYAARLAIGGRVI
jgi:hypothetical protein